MAGHRLDFGELDLVNADGGYGAYWFETLVDGFSWGSPEAVKVVSQSLMRDGSDSRIDHYENRFLTITVRVCGPDSGALDQGELALSLEVGDRSELSWTPPDGFGGTTVWDVLNSTMDPDWDDLAETREGVKWRVFVLTLEALPFGHPPEMEVASFSIATPTFTTISDGSATTGWTIPAGGDIATGVISTTTHLGEASIKRTKTSTGQPAVQFAGTWGATPYVAFDVDISGQDFPPTNSLYTSTGFQFPLAQEMRSSGYMRLYFDNPGVTAQLQLGVYDTPTVDVYIGGLYGATSLPTAGILSADIKGSVRTEGTIVIEAASALDDVMAFFDPAMAEFGYIPDNKDSWKNCPEGTYEVYLMETSHSHAVGSELSVTVGTQAVKSIVEYGSADATYVPLGRLALGGLRSGRAGTFTLTASLRAWSGSFGAPTDITSTASVRLLRVAPETSLTFARGMTKKRLLIDIPSLQYKRGGVWAGDATDGSDAVSVLDACDAWEYPTLTPGRTGAYIRATPATISASATYPPRYRTFAPLDES